MYNIGTWELPSLATDKLNPAVRDDIDFFTLPTTDGSVTAANEFVSPSGIGMAVNSKTYDPLVSDFLKFALDEVPGRVRGHRRALADDQRGNRRPRRTPLRCTRRPWKRPTTLGDKQAMPWDTQLDPTTNGRLQQELVLLVQGNITPEQFTKTHGRAPSRRTRPSSSSKPTAAGARQAPARKAQPCFPTGHDSQSWSSCSHPCCSTARSAVPHPSVAVPELLLMERHQRHGVRWARQLRPDAHGGRHLLALLLQRPRSTWPSAWSCSSAAPCLSPACSPPCGAAANSSRPCICCRR